jgi:hypothetical protein
MLTFNLHLTQRLRISGLCLTYYARSLRRRGQLYALSGVPAVRPHFIKSFIQFGVAAACENVPRKHEFRENLYGESRTAPTGVNEFWFLYSTFSG